MTLHDTARPCTKNPDGLHLNPGEIPSFKLFESEKTLAFMDIQPLSKGHAVRPVHPPSKAPRPRRLAALRESSNPPIYALQLIIPKFHGEKLADIPDEHLTELLVRSGLYPLVLVLVHL